MSNPKPTVVIGASPNTERYSYKATLSLQQHGHPVFPLGLREGNINGVEIMTEMPALKGIDTVTLYVGPENQPYWKAYVFSLNPKRVIFNPGTENPEFAAAIKSRGIKVLEACTLVLLSTKQY